MHRQPSLKHLNQIVEQWNAAYPVGTPVTVRKDNGEIVSTVTTSAAQVLSGHTAVIWVEGISGAYLLARVSPIRPTVPPGTEAQPDAV